jgi:putative ABC transport system substrate-binding protein
MKRRQFIAMVGGMATWPLSARAQSERIRRIGVLVLNPQHNPTGDAKAAALQQGLEKLGWTIGRNIEIDYQWGIAETKDATDAVAALIASKSDLLLTNSVAATQAAKQATRSVPIVFTGVSEPVELGFVQSLSRPGGNITGFTNLEPSVGGKWLELVKQIAPDVSRVIVMFSEPTPVISEFIKSISGAASTLGSHVIEARVHLPSEFDSELVALSPRPGDALILLPDTFLGRHFKQIVELETRYRLPAIHPFRFYVDAGGLISYGPDLVEQFRESAAYVDRILRGEHPADLPIQQPTKFQTVINLKTAKALGLTVPQSLLTTADELIE